MIITLPSDINLKPAGKGILLFMLRKPDDWRFNYKNFEKELGIGKKAIRTLIKNLEELKYLKKLNEKDMLLSSLSISFFLYKKIMKFISKH